MCLNISSQFLEELDTIVIPRDYPAISSEAVDRTIFEPLSLVELHARLTVVSAPGWRVDSNKKTVGPFCQLFSLEHTTIAKLLSCRGGLLGTSILQCIQISKRGVDSPENSNFKPEELHNYPPRIVCRFNPEDHTPPRTTCTLSFTGFDEEVEFSVLLMAPKAQRHVDTKILQVY